MPADYYHVLCQGPPLFPNHLRSCEATKVAPTGMVLEAVRRMKASTTVPAREAADIL